METGVMGVAEGSVCASVQNIVCVCVCVCVGGGGGSTL